MKRQTFLHKKKLWRDRFRHNFEFMQTFFSFHDSSSLSIPTDNDHDSEDEKEIESMIPFHYLSCMHFSQEKAFHFLRQLLWLVHILMTQFGILLPSLSLEHIYLKKMSSTRDVVIVKSSRRDHDEHSNHDIFFPCCFGYHVHIKGFEDCIFLNTKHALFFQSMPPLFHPFHRIVKEMSSHFFSTPYRNKIKRMLKNLPFTRHDNLNIFPKYENDDTDLHCDLLSLVDIHVNGSMTSTMERDTVRHELDKMYNIFHKEYDILRSKFSNRRNIRNLTKDWLQILRLYKNDFFENPEMTLPILRKLFYQYMVERSYNHIDFKSFDLPRMITALYLWSQWYERYFHEHVWNGVLCNYNPKEVLVVIGCLDLFFEKDAFDYTEQFIDSQDDPSFMTIHEFVIDESSFTIFDVDHQKFREYLLPIHPMMRTSYLSKLSENQYKDFCRNT